MAFARLSDPATSHEAADSVVNISKVQESILGLLREREMSDEQLVLAYHYLVYNGHAPAASDPSIRSRRAELARMGLVSVVGYTVTVLGRRARVWKASNV